MANRRPKKLKVKSEEAEREKMFLLKVGVACLMSIFFVFWIFNLRYQFKINSGDSGRSGLNWEEAKTELDQAMGQVKEGLARVKQARQQVQTTLPREPELTAEQIDLLKGKLMNETVGSTTASSTKQ
ncbi:MAG: hypothetical protein Q8O93_02815 [bacterium]|nr:hypothetical protein [bacterium]